MTTETEQTASQVLAAARKTLREAKSAERKARANLSTGEQRLDRQFQEARILTGTKEVEVDFTVDADDLADLGYHHQDACGYDSQLDGWHDPADDGGTENRRVLLDWHDKQHGLSRWQSCPLEPCNLLTNEYRETP